MVVLRGLGALILLLALAAGVLLGISWGARGLLALAFEGVDPTVSAAIVAAVATTTVSVITVFVGRYFERRREIEAEIRKSKIPVYTDLVQSLMSVLTKKPKDDGQEESEADPNELARAMYRITPQLITWANDDVLIKWSRWRRKATDLAPMDSMFQLEQLLQAIRKDFGHSDKKVERGDVLGLFVNDIEDYVGDGSGPASKGQQA